MSGKVSSQLNGAIESYLENSGDITAHLSNKSNPHEVTKEQVGLSSVTNDKQATEVQLQAHTTNVTNPHSVTKAQVGLSNVTNDKQATEVNLNAHTANINNPHTVTKTQVGLGNVLDAEQATKAEFDIHASASNPHSINATKVGLGNVTNVEQASKTEFNTHTNNENNPHAVTKSQVGLSNVDNIQQASKSEYNSHVAGTADKHSATDVVYDELHNVKEYVDQLALESGTGTMDHSLLLNRDLTNAHPMSAITGLTDTITGIENSIVAITEEKYTFLGITENSTETEIFTTDTGTYIDENGRIKVPVSDTALAIEMKLIYGGQAGSSDRFFTARHVTQTAIANRTASTVTVLRTSDPIIAGSDTLSETAFSLSKNDAPSGTGDGSLSLKVVGINNTLWWKAIFTITPMLFSEF